MQSCLHPDIADAIVGHGDRKKDVKSLYLAINDADLVREIDRLTFDHRKAEIWEQRRLGGFPWGLSCCDRRQRQLSPADTMAEGYPC